MKIPEAPTPPRATLSPQEQGELDGFTVRTLAARLAYGFDGLDPERPFDTSFRTAGASIGFRFPSRPEIRLCAVDGEAFEAEEARPLVPHPDPEPPNGGRAA